MHLLDCIMGNQNSLYDINAEMSSELFQKRRTTYSSNFHGPPLSYSAGRRVKVKSIPCEPTEGMDIQLTGIRRWKGNCDLLLLPFPKQNQRLSTFPGNLFFSTRIFSS